MDLNPWLIALAIVGIILLLVVIMVITMIPEMRRYLRMRRM